MRKRTTTVALGATTILLLAGAGCSDEGNVFSLEEGTCFQEPENTSEVAEVETVDCDDRHFAEVFHVQEVEADGDDFPGDSVIAEQATEACLGEAFEDFTGVPFENDSAFGAFPLSPSEGSWDDGDREIVCSVISLQGEQLTGSAEGEGVPFGEDEGGQAPPIEGGEEAGEPTQPPDIADPAQAALAQECFDGSGSACDELFFATPVDSPEEEYGNTCGGRFDASPGLCADVIGG